MSLIQRVSSKALQDLINEGYRQTVLGTTGGPVTDQVILSIPADRAAIVTGFYISSSVSASQIVTLGFKKGATTAYFFTGYLKDVAPIAVQYALGDWRYGDLEYSLVLTTGAATAFSVFCRVTSEAAPLGFIQQIAAPQHHCPWLPPDSAKDRGASEF